MRALIALVLLGGCVGGSRPDVRPVMMPSLAELPSDPTERQAILESSEVVAEPEQRPGMTRKEFEAETVAATAAAILGTIFSSHH
jgi:hypothetical protein